MNKETAQKAAQLITDISKCSASSHTAKIILDSFFMNEPEKNAVECEQLRHVIAENERDVVQAQNKLAELFEQGVPAFGDIRVLPDDGIVRILAQQQPHDNSEVAQPATD